MISLAVEMQSEEILNKLINKVSLTNVDDHKFNDLMRALQLGNVKIFTILWSALENQGKLDKLIN